MLHGRHTSDDRRLAGGLAVVFALVAVLAAIDLVSDAAEGITIRHAIVEGGVLMTGLVGLIAMGRRFRQLVRRERELVAETTELAGKLAAEHGEAERWKREAGDLLRGLSQSIDEQLTRWQLTPAEKEVALLLLKGLSMKEAAAVRGVTEPTARQQARAVYRKADLAGRSELSAFFLEDLLVPQQAAELQ